MAESYTLRMLAMEFWALTHNDWDPCPKFQFQTEQDSLIRHGTSESEGDFQVALATDVIEKATAKVLAGPRGTMINSQLDRDRLLQYCEWSHQPMDVGVAFPILQALPEENVEYSSVLRGLWFERLQGLSPQVACECQVANITFGYTARVWYAPVDLMTDWKPLSESPTPKDKWVTNEAYALSYPPMSDEIARASATILFTGRLQERYDDPEVQGGKIELIATKQQLVQKPPNCLDRMTARRQQQVAYNQRVLKAEDEIAGINSDVAEFLFELDPVELITISVHSEQSMKKSLTILGGQYWKQGEDDMTATNGTIEGTPNTREAAILSATVEAVE
jgi:hypothetical protein